MSEDSIPISSRLGLTGEEKASILGLYIVLAIATLFGFIGSIVIAQALESTFLFGLCMAAFVLGLRHGVDADHIVAI
ncbi:hypothetical protein E6H22_02240, partial [Candidatus Bathyarchaeota archaeon]